MNTYPELLTPAFRALCARLGRDPLQIQAAGGNTSVKNDSVMWIKASGTQLAQVEDQDIFVPVDPAAARAEAAGAGDGSCKATVIDPNITLRPSIETTFHAALPWRIVVHTHSVATLVHAISPEGRAALSQKLEGLPFVQIGYHMPGRALTQAIMAEVRADTQVIILQNHGLICCGDTVKAVADLIVEVENRLGFPAHKPDVPRPKDPAPEGYDWTDESWLAQDGRVYDLVTAGTYYPDHLVFLGPGLAPASDDASRPAMICKGKGVLLRRDATPSQKVILRTLAEVFSRLPQDWSAIPIGPDAEAALLNWDAEKYRQKMAAQP